MKKIDSLNYDNVPGVKSSGKILIKSLLRKFYIYPKLKLKRGLVGLRFNIISRKIEKLNKNRKTKIPKIIHYIWVGGNPKPNTVYEYIKSWQKFCPDYLIIEWNELNYDISSNRYAKEAYQAKKWAFVTDYMRLDILDRFGGVYLDSDVEVIKNLDSFLDKPAFSGFEIGDPGFILIPTGTMGSEPGNAWIKYLKEYYDASRSFMLSDGSYDMTTNTNIITKMTKNKYKLKINNKLQKKDDFVMYPNDFFCPKSWSTGRISLTNNTHTIHHFAGSWKKE